MARKEYEPMMSAEFIGLIIINNINNSTDCNLSAGVLRHDKIPIYQEEINAKKVIKSRIAFFLI